MEITGGFEGGSMACNGRGAFTDAGSKGRYVGSGIAVGTAFDFAASRSWTGETSGPSSGQSGSTGGNENRPANLTIRIWKRIA